jgi:GntR family transcriptional activator of glc operon
MSEPKVEITRNVADFVAERIEALIVDGVLRPGQALPSERRLTVKLDASRAALREGLKLLRARGIIETKHGSGSYVAVLTSQQALTPMMHLLGTQPRTLYDLFEVREMLEAESARLAALRGTKADFAMITRRYEEMLAANDSDATESARARLDYAFHIAICEASHNPVLVHTLSSLTDLLLSSVFASVNNLYHRAAEKRLIDKQHTQLYKAVLGKNPTTAQKTARAHLATACSGMKEIEAEEQRLVRATLRLKGRE